MTKEHLPETFLEIRDPPGVHRPRVFEPALKHFASAFRNGEPTFADPALARAWRLERRRALDQLLGVLARPSLAQSLVLRGSAVLPAWLGAAAREPGDLDCIVVPTTQTIDSAATVALTEVLRAAVDASSKTGPVELLASEMRSDDIWTYERVPGRRLVFPWRSGALPLGVLQLDLVFGEVLVSPPVTTAIPTLDGASVSLPTASPALSLAWKLEWLATDSYPQPKDLYDATLLGEHTALRTGLLVRALEAHQLRFAEVAGALASSAKLAERIGEDAWASFQREHPGAAGSLASWTERLQDAVAPALFDD